MMTSTLLIIRNMFYVLLYLITCVLCGCNKQDISARVSVLENKCFDNCVGMHMIRLNSGYWVSAHEVTEGQYANIMGLDAVPIIEPPATYEKPIMPTAESRYPVRNIEYNDAAMFCSKLTLAEQNKGTLPSGHIYSMPLWSQWREYVADAKIDDSFLPTDTSKKFDMPRPVGAGKANRLGIYDARGNIDEFCADFYDRKKDWHYLAGGSFADIWKRNWELDVKGPMTAKKATNVGFRVILIEDTQK